MNHIVYSQNKTSYSTAILIKETYLDAAKIKNHYLKNINPDDVIAFGLPYLAKITVAHAKTQLNKLMPALAKLGVTTLYVADATYFKALTRKTKAEPHAGYVLDCAIKNYEHIKVIYGVNYGQLLYAPALSDKLDLTVEALYKHLQGDQTQLGDAIVHKAIYPTEQEIPKVLAQLNQYPKLTIDIETTGLQVGSRLLSIAFAWSKHEGVAFEVKDTKQLKMFFETYRGRTIFHNATFDIKHIIYNCFMKHSEDYNGLIHGLNTMCDKLEDTKLIAYLATNNTQGNELSLKALSHEYTGSYAIDVKALTGVTEAVLEYNLKDTLATMYVYEKYYPIMLKDNQLDIYQNIMVPSIKTIIQMELIGMPVDMDRIYEVREELDLLHSKYMATIMEHELVRSTEEQVKLLKLIDINSKLKTIQHGKEKVEGYKFNPGSSKHLQELLYMTMRLPVIDYTKTKQPATGTQTLEKLINHTQDKPSKELLKALIGLNKVDKILSTFIPALVNATLRNNWHYLQGNFNMGGTLSGRMSSSSPNLQNIPSSSEHAKLIKSCFKAKKGWLMVGADFNALESRINTLLTKDPNKMKVFIDGYDSHCINAYGYFKEQMPDIEDTLESINSIKHKYPHLRQDSKRVTFAAQYGGTYITFMNNCGFDESTAKQIEANYHKLYEASDTWVQSKLDMAARQGYIDTAFGLRIRTPVIAKSLMNTSKTPRIAESEARSVANALSGQAYGLLTNRAVNAFMEKVWDSPYRTDIMPISLIHDAIYLMVRDDVRAIEWVNNNLIKEMQWQGLPEIQHPQVHLEAELDLFYPSWGKPITLDNNLSQQQIKEAVMKAVT